MLIWILERKRERRPRTRSQHGRGGTKEESELVETISLRSRAYLSIPVPIKSSPMRLVVVYPASNDSESEIRRSKIPQLDVSLSVERKEKRRWGDGQRRMFSVLRVKIRSQGEVLQKEKGGREGKTELERLTSPTVMAKVTSAFGDLEIMYFLSGLQLKTTKGDGGRSV